MKTANHNNQVQLSNHHNATVAGRFGLVAALSLWFSLGINFLPVYKASAQAPLPPSLGPIPDQTTMEDLPVYILLTVSDLDTPANSLIFTGGSSNTNFGEPNLVSGISFTVTASRVVATVNLVPNANGFAAVTISVSDGTSTVSRDFALTVNPVEEEPPFLGPLADQTTAQDVPLRVPLTVSDVDTDLSKLVFTGTSSNPGLVSGISFTVTGTIVFATVTPVAGASGFAAVTLTVTDGTTPVSRDFALTVLKPPKLAASFSGQTLRVTLTGMPGNYVVEKATILGVWTETVNVTINSSGTGEISVSTIGAPQQFFRVKSQ